MAQENVACLIKKKKKRDAVFEPWTPTGEFRVVGDTFLTHHPIKECEKEAT